ncbi:oligosaccharide flippase family protein [Paracoccus siganidrum]|uniref:Polysaccharide biosynthesis protein n=2 Tax=Pseudomonadota TaxID=1224 RepID=A0A419A934_9RHOB|nr:oligosaccharide flippase family protein [Paracoccus siganidrum]RJL18561.1 polysaccharide biosynthesis protein [Paracoccus siganidrum]RMC36799.1 polysaccharide biosynthesis protein [Paracoccus siganidrum]
MRRWKDYLSGSTITARVLRGSAVSGIGYVGGQGLRLASNLILTRLLYPDAFGVMALVTMVVIAVFMMSDLGLVPSIMQSKRGDDPKFLETAWSVKLILHAIYFAMLCLLAVPVARFYQAPELAQLIPVVALGVLVAGLVAPNVEHAMRHIRVGPSVAIEIGSQFVALVFMIAYAWISPSIWALAWGQVVAAIVKVAISRAILPGPAMRPRWDPSAVHELVGFGKWILLSSASGFVLAQGDKVVLGKYLSLEMLGIYNIAFFLASFPMALAQQICGSTMIPVYRDTPPHVSAANFATVRRMRLGLSVLVMGMIGLMGLAGPMLVALLYDARYAEAGQIISLIACAQIPMVLGMTYPAAALAAGDSRGPSILTVLRAVVQIAGFLAGVELAGLPGAIIGQAAASWVMHLGIVSLALRHRVWDGLHDLLVGGAGLILSAVILGLHPPF